MEADPQNPSSCPPHSVLRSDAQLSIIRTETILSRFPVHNLSKKGRVDIQITKAGPKGDIELYWEVSYSERYGQARQLAYKLDTIVVDQRIDEAVRPLPERLRLGSLNQIAQELGLASDQGTNHKNLKRAFRQNALAGITAKFRFKGNDGTERALEATFTRYNVIFTGEKLSDGRRADAVYIQLNPIYREVLNDAPFRPLNFEYKKQLSPAAQRFYEIVSYKIFAALKHNHPIARLPYSEYCTFSTQQRYFDYDHFKKQMYKIHRPHLTSGYLEKVSYQEATDENGRLDWAMCYVPGPKARIEYATLTLTREKSKTDDAGAASSSPQTVESASSVRVPRQRRLKLSLSQETEPKPPATIDYSLVHEMGKRGIGETDACKLLASLPPGQPILDQLEYGDRLIARKRGHIDNPPGFYISLLQRNVPVPPDFVSSRKAKAIEEANSAEQQALRKQHEEAIAAEEAQTASLDSLIEQLSETARLALLAQAKAELIAQYPGMATFFKTRPDAAAADGAVRAKMRKLITEGWTPPNLTPQGI
jgi:hypothetical protein